MDIDEKLVRKLVHLAYHSKKKRIRKKYKALMFEMIQEQIEKEYAKSLNLLEEFKQIGR